jgi:acetyl esterase/lipase
VGRRLAAHGVLTVVADYRTWPAAGFPDFVHDAARATAWAREHAAAYGGDPRRIYLAGHSAGAQIAALLGTDSRYLQAQGFAASALAGVIGLSGPYEFDITGKLRQVFGAQAQWPDAMPIRFVDGDEPRFLLVHGRSDRTVESRDSVDLAAALEAAGVEVELLLLDGAGHVAPIAALYDPKRAPEVLPALLGFIGHAKQSEAARGTVDQGVTGGTATRSSE